MFNFLALAHLVNEMLNKWEHKCNQHKLHCNTGFSRNIQIKPVYFVNYNMVLWSFYPMAVLFVLGTLNIDIYAKST